MSILAKVKANVNKPGTLKGTLLIVFGFCVVVSSLHFVKTDSIVFSFSGALLGLVVMYVGVFFNATHLSSAALLRRLLIGGVMILGVLAYFIASPIALMK